MQLKEILANPAMSVFLGTFPLLLTIAWGLFTSDRRLTRIETKLDTIDAKLSGVSERLVKVETKIEGRQVVMGD